MPKFYTTQHREKVTSAVWETLWSTPLEPLNTIVMWWLKGPQLGIHAGKRRQSLGQLYVWSLFIINHHHHRCSFSHKTKKCSGVHLSERLACLRVMGAQLMATLKPLEQHGNIITRGLNGGPNSGLHYAKRCQLFRRQLKKFQSIFFPLRKKFSHLQSENRILCSFTI